jgi:hypothetical protein
MAQRASQLEGRTSRRGGWLALTQQFAGHLPAYAKQELVLGDVAAGAKVTDDGFGLITAQAGQRCTS